MLLDASAVIFGNRTFGPVVMGGIGLSSSSSSSSPLPVQCWRMVGSGTLPITYASHRLFLNDFFHFRYWSSSALNGGGQSPVFYISLYAVITAVGLVVGTIRWFILYRGSIHASDVLYKRLLESILFADIRFHDTVSRGRVLNRFGKDFEGRAHFFRLLGLLLTSLSTGIDSSLSDNFGRSVMYGLSASTTIVTVSVVGGLPFVFAAMILGIIYWNGRHICGHLNPC